MTRRKTPKPRFPAELPDVERPPLAHVPPGDEPHTLESGGQPKPPPAPPPSPPGENDQGGG